jgi:hypothetical protein
MFFFCEKYQVFFSAFTKPVLDSNMNSTLDITFLSISWVCKISIDAGMGQSINRHQPASTTARKLDFLGNQDLDI